uniref:Uncharacterized protein n=1 Tax=Cacopsylla melanoneura TaxID=428564 RepID=A0A8D9AC54_9HEMI
MVLMIPLIVFMTILMKSQTLMHHICCYVCENSWMGENKWIDFISTQERHRIHPDKNIGTPYEDYCKVVNRLSGRRCYYGKELYQCYTYTNEYVNIYNGQYPNVKRGASPLSRYLRPVVNDSDGQIDNCGYWWVQRANATCLYCDSDLCNDFSYSNRNLELNGLYDDFYLDKEKENLIMDTDIIPSLAPQRHGQTRLMIAAVVLKSIVG